MAMKSKKTETLRGKTPPNDDFGPQVDEIIESRLEIADAAPGAGTGIKRRVPVPRGDAAPTEGFGLQVDGKIKSKHETAAAANDAGTNIKRKFPVVQVIVFDAANG